MRSAPASSTAASTASKPGRLPWMSDRTAMRMSRVLAVEVRRLRLPVALVTAVVVAEAAVLVLRPRDGVIDPAPVNVRSYFSQHELARARSFRRPQLALGGGQLAIELG